MFLATGPKILGREATDIFFNYFFLEKYIILCIWKGISPFNMHKIIHFPRKPEKNSRAHQLIKLGLGYPKHRYFIISPKKRISNSDLILRFSYPMCMKIVYSHYNNSSCIIVQLIFLTHNSTCCNHEVIFLWWNIRQC